MSEADSYQVLIILQTWCKLLQKSIVRLLQVGVSLKHLVLFREILYFQYIDISESNHEKSLF